MAGASPVEAPGVTQAQPTERLGAQVRRLAQALIGGEGAPADRPGFAITARRGLVFSGSRQFVFVGVQSRLAISDHRSFTLEAWFVASGGGTVAARFDSGEKGQGEFALGVDEAGRPYFHYFTPGEAEGKAEPVAAQITSPQAIAFGRLTHLSVTGDARTLTLYLDGEAVAHRPATVRSLRAERVPLLLGACLENRQPARFFRGTLLAVTLHRSCLDATAILGAAHGRRAPQRQLIVATWNFHEGEGLMTMDESGGGHHAALGKGLSQFAPAWATPKLWIGPGSYFVDGMLCENAQPMTFDAQPQAPGTSLPEPREGEQLAVYLHVWERSFARPDAAPVVQVKVCRSERWSRLQRHAGELPEVAVRLRPGTGIATDTGYRLEIHTPGAVLGSDLPVGDCAAVASVDFLAQRIVLARPSGAAEDWFEAYAQAGAIELAARSRSRGDTADRALVLSTDAAAHALVVDFLPPVLAEPQALFVRPLATFKWSRDGAVIAFAVSAAGRDTLDVLPRARAPELPEVGSWIELVDERTELGRRPGTLRQIRAIVHGSRAGSRLTLDGPLPPASSGHPGWRGLARLWSVNPQARGPALQVARAGWFELEGGIEVSFSCRGLAQAGDHWTFQARPGAPGRVDWPTQAGVPSPVKPQGAARHVARLATLWYEGTRPRVRDERNIFDVLGHQVDRTGDTMTGRLRIRADLEVSGETHLTRVRVGELHGRLAPGIVGTEQLVDGAVSLAKLAEDIGTVPPGFNILGPRPQAPAGYRATGSSVDAVHNQPRWIPLPRGLPESGRAHAVVLGRSLFLLYEGSGSLWEWNLAQPSANGWRSRRALPEARAGLAVATLGAALHVVGGSLGRGAKSTQHHTFRPETDEWQVAAALPLGRSELALCGSGGRLYALGGHRPGRGARCCARVDRFDPATGRWTTMRSLPLPLAQAACAAVGNRIFVIGGESRGRLGKPHASARALVYSPPSDQWRELSPPPQVLPGAAVTALAGRLYVAGGEGAGGAVRSVFAYQEALDDWELLQPMGAARASLCLAGDVQTLTLYALGGNARNSGESCQLVTRLFVHSREHDPRMTTQSTALMERVVECTRAGQIRDAADLLRQAVSLSPTNFALRASLCELLIQVLVQDGHDDALLLEIEAQMEAMATLQPRSAQLQRLCAVLERATGQAAGH